MYLVKIALPVLVLFFGSRILCFSQESVVVPGSYLVQILPGKDVSMVLQAWRLDASSVLDVDTISPVLRIFSIHTRNKRALPAEALHFFAQNPDVIHFQANHVVEDRKAESVTNFEPNDPLFSKQWHLQNSEIPGADVGALDAWNFSTGGVTPAGDSIVIAIIDAGFNVAHPDLSENCWKNGAEIPNDGLDNDQNGFIDDYNGWNVFSNKDVILGNGGSHGTPIAGIIGARGNNGIGISGINWNAKMMLVVGGNTEAYVLKAYDYILRTRKLYNATQGKSGAMVVAVNCSWGLNYGKPSDAPLWCAVLDSLGAAGILTVAATANLPINVDENGDLPTSCPSPYLISVTSLNKWNQKAAQAAWGPVNIDLGAYGAEVYSTSASGSYDYFDGTSFAAPQVSGALGLLYAAPCSELTAQAYSDPSGAALRARDLLLSNTIPTSGLQGLTASEGRLNVYSMMQGFQSQCNACEAPFSLKNAVQSTNEVGFSWLNPSNQEAFFELELQNQAGLVKTFTLNYPYLKLSGLDSCQWYTYRVRSMCIPDSLWSAWSYPSSFRTQGCCLPPVLDHLDVLSDHEIALYWKENNHAALYELKYRVRGDSLWNSLNAVENELILNDLQPCTEYEFCVRTICSQNLSVYSGLFQAETKGCGVCKDKAYCNSGAKDASKQWISKIELGNWSLDLGLTGAGYADYGVLNGQSLPEFHAGEKYPIHIAPAFSGASSKLFYRVYLDWDGNGIFEDVNLCFDPGFAHDQVASGFIEIPLNATQGICRMRCMIKTENDLNGPPEPCEFFEFGQVLDFCVMLNGVTATHPVETSSTETPYLYPMPAHQLTTVYYSDAIIPDCQLQVRDAYGRLIHQCASPDFPYGIPCANWMPGFYWVSIVNGSKHYVLKIILN
ncbi:MAG: S8 family serine peptidase [Bacteroidetes bacterium]|nr:S8 family serine peptidase [Bacteroidota bacterium]